jgi:hypothetical protein
MGLLCVLANPPLAWSDMKDATAVCRVREYKDITQNLREELLGKNTGFLDAFYDVQSIQDTDLRPLVEQSRSETARWLGQVREKLKPRTCEVESERQEQSNYVIRFLINGDTRLELFVDDVYEAGGCLHVRDQIKIKLLPKKE